MRKLTRAALALAGAGALLMGGAPAALADHATTVQIQDPATGTWSDYSGQVRAVNDGSVTLTGFSPLGKVVTTCQDSELFASIDSDGHNGTLDDVSLTNCTNDHGGTTTIDALGLPYSGGEVVYDPSGSYTGYIEIFGPNPAVDIEAILDLPNDGLNGVECHYGLTNAAGLTIDVTAGDPSTGDLAGQTLDLVSGDSNCPFTASANGHFTIVAHPSGDNVRITS